MNFHSHVRERAWRRMYRHEALASQDFKCRYCFEPLKVDEATADHKKARSKGGLTLKNNIDAACDPCNIAKGSMTPAQFQARIKNPQHGDSGRIWRAWSRRRIWLATHRACKRIMEMVS